MTLEGLLISLRARRVRLVATGEALNVDAPTGMINDRLRRLLAEHKAELLALPYPYLNASNELVIPLNAPPQYHWQPLLVTLRELNAPPHIVARYIPARMLQKSSI